jgi:hypothetical protein
VFGWMLLSLLYVRLANKHHSLLRFKSAVQLAIRQPSKVVSENATNTTSTVTKAVSTLTMEEDHIGERAYEVFCNHILAEVADENQRLEVENEKRAPLLEYLCSVQIHVGQGGW